MKLVFGMAAMLVAFSAVGFAQGVQTGTIRGTVKDQQGLALPGATITATSPTLQGDRTVVTDTDGSFLFRAIPPGTYHLKVEMSGMSPIQSDTSFSSNATPAYPAADTIRPQFGSAP